MASDPSQIYQASPVTDYAVVGFAGAGNVVGQGPWWVPILALLLTPAVRRADEWLRTRTRKADLLAELARVRAENDQLRTLLYREPAE